MNAEGAALLKLGDYSGAESLLLESQKWLPKAQLPGLAERGRDRLAALYTAWGKPAEAQKYRVNN